MNGQKVVEHKRICRSAVLMDEWPDGRSDKAMEEEEGDKFGVGPKWYICVYM